MYELHMVSFTQSNAETCTTRIHQIWILYARVRVSNDGEMGLSIRISTFQFGDSHELPPVQDLKMYN